MRADGRLGRLPALNAERDTSGLKALTRELLPSLDFLAGLPLHETLAAMRDLGMCVSSLRRHGVEPTAAVPELEPALLLLGERSGMIPRDTVYHYAVWNPRGERQRMFTGDAHESALIECVRASVPMLADAIQTLLGMARLDPASPAYVEGCERTLTALSGLVDIIQFAKKNVDVAFFARGLRPYFDGVRVGGTEYLGPAAAHIPLWLIDHLLWGSDCGDVAFRRFADEASVHSPPLFRHFFDVTRDNPSLLSGLVRSTNQEPGSPLTAGAEAFLKLLRSLLTFRGKHRVMAGQAYSTELALYTVGSGGLPLEALDHMLQLTLTQTALLKAWRESGHRAHQG